MSWADFERCVKEVFRVGGWAVQSTAYFDAGSDVIAMLDGIEYAVQVKHSTNPEERIDVAAVEQAARGRDGYKATRALLVTNALITVGAEDRAAERQVQLWDRWALAQRMRALGLLALGAETSQPCPECGLGMVLTDLRSRTVWLCEPRAGGCGTRMPYSAPVLRLA
ncbi:MAG: restriction endonuclease [Candidatus Dormibacteria bacterium]|jgi:hypothetical protein